MSINIEQPNPPAYPNDRAPGPLLEWLSEIDTYLNSAQETPIVQSAISLSARLQGIANKMVDPFKDFVKLDKKGGELSKDDAIKKQGYCSQWRSLWDTFHWDALKLEKLIDVVKADERGVCVDTTGRDLIFDVTKYKVPALPSDLLVAIHFIAKQMKPYVGLNIDDKEKERGRADQARGEMLWNIDALLWNQTGFYGIKPMVETYHSHHFILCKLLLDNGMGHTLCHVGLGEPQREFFGRYIEVLGMVQQSEYYREIFDYNQVNGTAADVEIGAAFGLLEVLDRAMWELIKRGHKYPGEKEQGYPNYFLIPYSINYLSRVDDLVPFLAQALCEYISAFTSVPASIEYDAVPQQPKVWPDLRVELIKCLQEIAQENGVDEIWVSTETFDGMFGVPEGLLALEREELLSVTDIRVFNRDTTHYELKIEDIALNDAEVEVVEECEWHPIKGTDVELCEEGSLIRNTNTGMVVACDSKKPGDKYDRRNAFRFLREFIISTTVPTVTMQKKLSLGDSSVKKARMAANIVLPEVGSQYQVGEAVSGVTQGKRAWSLEKIVE